MSEPMDFLRFLLSPPTQKDINDRRMARDHMVCDVDDLAVGICPGLDDLEIWFEPANGPLVRVKLTEAAQRRFEKITPIIDALNDVQLEFWSWIKRKNVNLIMNAVRARRAGLEYTETPPEVPPVLQAKLNNATAELRATLKAFADEFDGQIDTESGNYI